MSTNFDDETLVAYLDGELPSEEASQVKHGLENDSTLRGRVAALQASWDILDILPEPELNTDLAQTTIEMVALSVEEERKAWWKLVVRNRWLMLGGLSIAMLIGGASFGRIVTNMMDDRFLSSLPAVVLSEALEETRVDDVQWLQEIASVDDLLTAGSFLIEERNVNVVKRIGDGLLPKSNVDRRAWIDNLSTLDQARLRDRFNSWRRADAEQVKFRELASYVYADDSDTQVLLNTLSAYEAILDDGGVSFKNDLEISEIDQRIQMLDQQIAEIMCRKYAINLTGQDSIAISDWLRKVKWDDYAYFQGGFMEPEDVICQELIKREEESRISQKTIDELVVELSREGKALLAKLESENTKRKIVAGWVLAVVYPDNSGSTSFAELERVFDSLLDRDERHLIELLPADVGRGRLEEKLGVPQATAE